MEQIAESSAPIDVPYATPASSSATHGHRVFAGVSILLGGLGLVVLGGCFLIGVMLISTHGFNTVANGMPLNFASRMLLVVLYVLATISFVCATLVILAALRGLFRVLRG